MAKCPQCRQPIRHARFGVYFPPLKARILDAIAAAGDVGISPQELARLCWSRGKEASISNVQSHISQINDVLDGSSRGVRIFIDRGNYQIARKRAA